METVTLSVTRRANFQAKLRKFTILVDGTERAFVKNGETVKIDITPGEHDIVVKMGRLKSEPYFIDENNSDNVNLMTILVSGTFKAYIYLVSTDHKPEPTIRHYGLGRFVLSLIFGGIMGILIYKLCKSDLQLMEEGYMDSSGKTLTKIASWWGLISFSLFIMIMIAIFAFLISQI